MYVRNCLSAGDYLIVVPVGIPITLQYDESGNIEKVFGGYQGQVENRIDLSELLLHIFIKTNKCPLKVKVSGGTCWVEGVLYTSKTYSTAGSLPGSWIAQMTDDFCKSPKDFNFFAGRVHSTAQILTGAAANTQWMRMAGYNVLPGYLIGGVPLNAKGFEHMVKPQWNFRYPYAMNYFIYRGSDFINRPIACKQVLCYDVQTKMNTLGELEAVISFGTDSITVSYSEVYKYQIQKGSLLLLDEDNKIVYCDNVANQCKTMIPPTTQCPVCGKLIRADSNPCICDDPQCLSGRYLQFSHFCNVLNLGELTPDEYWNLIYSDDRTVQEVSNLADMIEVRGAHINTDIKTILQAMITVQEVPDRSVIDKFIQKCNSSIETILYYANNPSRAAAEFGMNDINSRKLFRWFSDSANVLELQGVVYHNNVTVETSKKKFDGSPIFRGKTITLTGKFTHGDISDIIGILQSYSANVITYFDEKTDCILIGDIPEDVNGSMVKKAAKQGIPVYTETYFFTYYDIDTDLRQNLS